MATTVVVVVIGGLMAGDARAWHAGLDRAGVAPEGATHGAVWVVLLAAGTAAGFRAWAGSTGWRTASWWGAQMVLLAGWAIVYFGARSPLGGLVVMVFLLASVAGNLRASSRVDTTAAALLMPLAIWCLFAAAANIGVVVLNDGPGLLG